MYILGIITGLLIAIISIIITIFLNRNKYFKKIITYSENKIRGKGGIYPVITDEEKGIQAFKETLKD